MFFLSFLFFLKKFNLIFPINNFYLRIYKFNNFLFFFFILFFIFFFSIFFMFFFYNFFLKNNKFFFLKSFFFESFFIFIPFFFINLFFFYSIFLILKLTKYNNIYLNVKIISYQWKWYFIYLNNINKKNFNYFSNFYNCLFKILNFNNKFLFYKFYLQSVDNKLILPINKNIRFIFLSNDVIHSLYLPSLGLKQDLIPGFLKNFYFKSKKLGKYFGFCTELCGKNHSYMPFILKVISNYCYKKWKNSFFLKKFLFLNY